MATITIAFLGDIFGAPGRMAVREGLPWVRRQYEPDIVIANAENARAGSGLSPELYHKIRGYGVDAVTLGDHIYRDRKIISILEQPDEPIARPANLSEKAIGRPYTRLPPQGGRRDGRLLAARPHASGGLCIRARGRGSQTSGGGDAEASATAYR